MGCQLYNLHFYFNLQHCIWWNFWIYEGFWKPPETVGNFWKYICVVPNYSIYRGSQYHPKHQQKKILQKYTQLAAICVSAMCILSHDLAGLRFAQVWFLISHGSFNNKVHALCREVPQPSTNLSSTACAEQAHLYNHNIAYLPAVSLSPPQHGNLNVSCRSLYGKLGAYFLKL